MGLQCLILTRDPNLLGQIKATLHGHRASLDLRQDSASAIELASRRHWDGIVVDCDDVAGGTEVITQVRSCRSNRQTLIFAVINGSTTVDQALDLGANFVICKTAEEGRLRGVLDATIPKMEREHRRYFRYEVDLPIQLRNHDGQTFSARMKNVSEGGLCIKLVSPRRFEGLVTVEFDVPGAAAEHFQAKADVVWSDSSVMGLCFLYTDKDSGIVLQTWLNSLEAQSQVHDCLSAPSRS
ncbi:MAG TPA: PilZ domain-containing protein [Terriglobales bacterium]|nr:PilZ domain-containing protein [Terriglobales bacterium]